ncbi:MAG TPA: CPBP family intramembrane glutamic endopeptidase [Bacillales bacterium]|nr:CPBP family intramembrane glutamic endopeptidase [Bacillales bacterium]
MRRKQSQAEKIRQLSDHELIINLYVTQLLLAAVTVILAFLFFDYPGDIGEWIRWRPLAIVMYGGGFALLVLLLDWFLTVTVPDELYSDGGVNERIFSALSVPHIFVAALVIAVVEECLFRGVLQVQFGIVFASALFAVLHIRYLRKVVLFFVTVVLSFMLGWLFLVTHNLLATIFAHFVIDFVLGVTVHFHAQKKGGGKVESTENGRIPSDGNTDPDR